MTVEPHFLLAVPGGVDPSALAEAVASAHPDARISLVGTASAEPMPDEPLGIGWRRLGLALDPRRLALAAGVLRARSEVDAAREVVVLLAGSVIVTGPLDALWATEGALVVPARVVATPPPDGLHPSIDRLLVAGMHSPLALRASAGAEPALDAMHRLLVTRPRLEVGRIVDLLAVEHEVSACPAPGIAVGPWKAPAGPIGLIDAEHFDPSRPWIIDGRERRPRVRLSEQPVLRELLVTSAAQLGGSPSTPSMPDGRPVDHVLREILLDAIETMPEDPFPDPFSSPDDFTDWMLESGRTTTRFWDAVLDDREDLRAEFPRIHAGELHGFREWIGRAGVHEYVGPWVRQFERTDYGLGEPARESGGVNVIGYLDRVSGIGIEAAQLADQLALAGVPVSRVAIGDSVSPLVDDPPHLDQRLRFDTNLVVVTAEQLGRLPEQLGQDPFEGRRTIGYWLWELSTPSPAAHRAIDMVDAVWAPSRFVCDAFATLDPTKVQLAPRSTPAIGRHELPGRDFFGLPRDRFVLLCALDLHSAVDRKNPFGAIDAFCEAFAPDEGPLLLIKTINGDQRGDALERIRLAIGDRPDILLRDGALPRRFQLGLLATADVLVSLHRSEGYGLHLAEALALGTPVLATAYSAPVEFLDDATAELVPYRLVPVEDADGAYTFGEWADPDIPAAAAAMRRLHDDPERRERMSGIAGERFRRAPGTYITGLRLRLLLQRFWSSTRG